MSIYNDNHDKILKILQDNFTQLNAIQDRIDLIEKHVSDLQDSQVTILKLFKDIKKFEDEFFKSK